jgi:hypothetical protein
VGVEVGEREDRQRVLFAFFNFRHRLILARPRRVELSRELSARIGSNETDRRMIERVREEAERGVELWPRLSRSIRDPFANDHLLNDWGVHHLHVAEVVDDDGFVTRDGPLLFAVVRGDTIYFVERLHHGTQSFATSDLVEILHSNWPQLIAHAKIPALMRADNQLTPTERRKVRTSGITSFVQTADGTVYAPMGGGYTTTGLSARVISSAHHLRDCTRAAEEWARGDAQVEWLRDAIFDKTGLRPQELDLEFLLSDPPAILERRTRAVAPVPFAGPPHLPILARVSGLPPPPAPAHADRTGVEL